MNTDPITIHAADIQPGMTVQTIPSVRSGRTTTTRITVAATESYVIDGHTFYDLIGTAGTTVVNQSGIYELVTERDA